MQRTNLPHSLGSLDQLSPGHAASLIATAQTLKRVGSGARSLKCDHVVVLCDAAQSASADAFAAAAGVLGATVVRIRPSASALANETDRMDLARTLGRLYGAIGCDGIDAGLLMHLVQWARVPVFNALSYNTHPTRMLSDLMTLSEAARKPIANLTLGMAATPGSPLVEAWKHAHALTGVRLTVWQVDTPVPSVDFFCHAPPSPALDAPVAWMAVDGNRVPQPVSAAKQNENHHFMIQSLLLNTVG